MEKNRITLPPKVESALQERDKVFAALAGSIREFLEMVPDDDERQRFLLRNTSVLAAARKLIVAYLAYIESEPAITAAWRELISEYYRLRAAEDPNTDAALALLAAVSQMKEPT
jgi:hypothetical protein